jgi:hypothetical protein
MKTDDKHKNLKKKPPETVINISFIDPSSKNNSSTNSANKI